MSASKYLNIRIRRTGLTGKHIRPIPGYENYFADCRGRIYASGKHGRLRQLTQFLSPNTKYLRVYLTKDRVKKNFYVHSLVLSAYRNYNPEKVNVMHLDRNRFNNRLTNLRLYETKTFGRKEKIEEYRIECLEEQLKEKAGYDMNTGLWKSYLKVKRTGTAKTALNWLVIVLKNL